jgi:hypothetical protein
LPIPAEQTPRWKVGGLSDASAHRPAQFVRRVGARTAAAPHDIGKVGVWTAAAAASERWEHVEHIVETFVRSNSPQRGHSQVRQHRHPDLAGPAGRSGCARRQASTAIRAAQNVAENRGTIVLWRPTGERGRIAHRH